MALYIDFAAAEERLFTYTERLLYPEERLFTPAGHSTTTPVRWLFYPVSQWEVQMCHSSLSTEIEAAQKSGLGFSSLYNAYADLTYTVAGQYYFDVYEGKTLYEVSWYLFNKESELKYNVYLVKGSSKWLIAKDVLSDPAQGSAGYFAEYNAANYTHMRLEYSAGGAITADIPLVESKSKLNVVTN